MLFRSYRELNERANRLAHYLQSIGVGPEVLVGVCMERTIDIVAALLAILKAGGAYVPIDPNYPKDRIRFMIEDTQTPALLTHSSLALQLPETKGRLLCLDDPEFQRALERQPVHNPSSGVQPDNLGYLIFTSGSTGRPKGVELLHRNAVSFVEWAKTVFPPESLDGVLFSTSVCFDLSVFEIFVTLASGGKLLVAENALQLPALPYRNEVKLINTVPSAIAELLRLDGVPSSVRIVNLAGEPLSTLLVNQLYSLPQIAKVYDLYGPSETTTYSTYTLRKKEAPATIGRPIANTQVYILDAAQRLAPPRVPGELCIGGDGVAQIGRAHV